METGTQDLSAGPADGIHAQLAREADNAAGTTTHMETQTQAQGDIVGTTESGPPDCSLDWREIALEVCDELSEARAQTFRRKAALVADDATAARLAERVRMPEGRRNRIANAAERIAQELGAADTKVSPWFLLGATLTLDFLSYRSATRDLDRIVAENKKK